MSLIAKPIVDNRLWVITDGKGKVGNVVADGEGYSVKIGNHEKHYASTKSIEKIVDIHFLRPNRAEHHHQLPYAIWPTGGPTYNDMFDIKRKLHMFTKTKNSKCYHVAGWFNIKIKNSWNVMFCPKSIFVNRYQYKGPYMNENEAKDS